MLLLPWHAQRTCKEHHNSRENVNVIIAEQRSHEEWKREMSATGDALWKLGFPALTQQQLGFDDGDDGDDD